MRKRTPEESAAYFREYRARKKEAAGASATPTQKKGATPTQCNTLSATPSPVSATPAPCPSCATHAAALVIAQERIVSLERQLAPIRTTTATPSAHKGKEEDSESLRQRVIAAKVDRINSYGKNPSIGTARF